jgi:hypothetical protein
MNYLPRLASNLNPPDLCLLSSWDFRREPPEPGLSSFRHLVEWSCLLVPSGDLCLLQRGLDTMFNVGVDKPG